MYLLCGRGRQGAFCKRAARASMLPGGLSTGVSEGRLANVSQEDHDRDGIGGVQGLRGDRAVGVRLPGGGVRVRQQGDIESN